MKKIYQKLIANIFDQLEKTPSDWPKTKIFIDGEFDSSQTDFESKSNHLEIGVIADSKRVGYILLFFLRIIIDKNYQLLEWELKDRKLSPKTKIETILKILEKRETNYTIICEFDQKIERDLFGRDGKFTVGKEIDQIDLWTLDKIKNELIDLGFLSKK